MTLDTSADPVRGGRFWLRGERAGSSEVVADNLPGFPDNIRAQRDGGFTVGLCGLR